LGVKNITVTVYKNGCSNSDHIKVTIKTAVGIGEDAELNKIRTYPNPVKTIINVELESNSNKVTLLLFDVLGNAIWSKNIEINGTTHFKADMSDLAYGTCYLKVISNGELSIIKVVKE